MSSHFPIDFSSFISHLPIAIFITDNQGEVVCSNQRWLDATGHAPSEIQSIEQFDTLGGTVSTAVRSIWSGIFSGQQPTDAIIQIGDDYNKKSKQWKLSGTLYQQEYAIFSAVDISDQIDLQETLEEKKEQFFSLINFLGDIILKLDNSGKVVKIWVGDASDSFPAIDLLEGKYLTDHFPEKVVAFFSSIVKGTYSINQPSEIEFSYICEGKERWYVAKVAPKSNRKSAANKEIIAILRDVTEERKIRHQIEYKNNLINQLTSIKNGPLLHVVEGNTFHFKFISGNLFSMTGYSDEEISEKNWLEIIHPEDRAKVINLLEQLKSVPSVLHEDLVYRICSKEGTINWVNNHISKTDDHGSNLFFGVLFNVTQIHLLNEKLKQRDRILTNTSKVANIGGWEYDFVNRQFNLTDELYHIHERNESNFNVSESPLYYAKEHQPLIQQYLKNLIEKGKSYDEELQLMTGNGVKKWVRSIGCAEWQNGQITHVYGILQDIDEKKKKDLILQENERRFNAAFELAPLGIGLISTEGQWLKVNSSLPRFFELTKNSLMEIPIQELKLTNILGRRLNWDWILQKNRQAYQLEEKYLTKDGKLKWGRISISSVKDADGKPLYFILQVVDITENKLYEEHLVVARKEAEEANKIKSDFLSTMTHEIRTPLFGVIGITNLLLEEIHDQRYHEQLRALKFSSDSLLLLVNDILDFSKIKSGALSLESKSFELRRVVDAVEELNLPKSKEKANRLTIDYDKNLAKNYLGDELRLGQILNNLINNAVKFTQNGFIGVSVKKTGESLNRDHILFSVTDTGIGIPLDKQSYIFEQFTQADLSISREYGGTGLGLPIVKGLAKAMGAEVELTSNLGKGTEISFELVLERVRKEVNTCSPARKMSQGKDLQNKTVLVVEDNPVSLMVTNDYINKWNGNTIKALDGLEAIEIFGKNMGQIDLVLMDLHLPHLNGFEAAERIKKIKADVPIIALTASVEDKNLISSGTSCLEAYLVKPFDPEQFYRILKTYL